jgi:hypothetical protein
VSHFVSREDHAESDQREREGSDEDLRTAARICPPLKPPPCVALHSPNAILTARTSLILMLNGEASYPRTGRTQKHQAAEFMDRISEPDRADEFDSMSVDEYADHRGLELVNNPKRKARKQTMARKSELQEQVDQAAAVLNGAERCNLVLGWAWIIWSAFEEVYVTCAAPEWCAIPGKHNLLCFGGWFLDPARPRICQFVLADPAIEYPLWDTQGTRESAHLSLMTRLSAAEKAGFEALITTDQEIPHQQNLRLRSTLPSPNLIQKRM